MSGVDQPPRPVISTFSGRFVDVLEPMPEDISILDIAHSLSHSCRWNGHVRRFYSVAQHSVLVADLVEARLMLTSEFRKQLLMYRQERVRQALLHDAHEAYMSDVPSPIVVWISQLQSCERALAKAVSLRFATELSHYRHFIHHADMTVRATEARDLCTCSEFLVSVTGQPLKERIRPWSPAKARRRFLQRYLDVSELSPGRRWLRKRVLSIGLRINSFFLLSFALKESYTCRDSSNQPPAKPLRWSGPRVCPTPEPCSPRSSKQPSSNSTPGLNHDTNS